MTLHEQFVDLWDRGREKRQGNQGQPPAPWQGISEIAQSLGINLGELWKTREEELKAARDAADATSKELHELRLREIDRRVEELQAIADKVEQKTQGQGAQGGQKSFLERLDEMTEGFVSRRIATMFGGDNKKEPTDPVEELVKRLDQTDQLKQRLGVGAGGTGAQALAQTGVRGELLKLLLEDERDRLKMQYDHEIQVERNKHLGSLATVVKENVSDGIQALRLAAQEIQKTGTGTAPKGPQTYECGACKTRFTIPTTEGWETLKCPNANCEKTWTRQEVLGS